MKKNFNSSPKRYKRARMDSLRMKGTFRKKELSVFKGILALGLIGILFSGSIFSLLSTNASNPNESRSPAYIASFWDLTGSPIFIDGTAIGDDAHNWTWAKLQPWCSGEGTFAQPYIIESVTINGQNISIPLNITNSDQYVEIRNCTFLNCTPATGAAGIKLVNVTNVKIFNCSISFNMRNPGIYVESSSNITASNVTIIENDSGIRFKNCSSSTISNNTLLNNRYYGISLGNNCSFCMISNNNISALLYAADSYGILLASTNNTVVLDNTFNYGDTGINIGSSNHLIISHNKIDNVDRWGIYIAGKNYNNTFSDNRITNCLTGMEFYTSSDNNYQNFQQNYTITGNYIQNCSAQGLDLFWRNCNFTITNNTIVDANTGIYFYGCNNSVLANNSIFNSEIGMYIDGNCQNTIIENNSMISGGIEFSILPSYAYDIRASNNVNGRPIYYYRNKPNLSTTNFTQNGMPGQILLDTCINSVIQDFSFTRVTNPIQASYSDDLTIKNVSIVNTTGNGISLYSCDRVNLTSNRIEDNGGFGLYASSCYYSHFNDNLINNSFGGMDLSICDNSNVSENKIFSTQYHAISNFLSDNMSITNSFINNSGDGIVVHIGSNSIPVNAGLIKNNTVQFSSRCGILLSAADSLVVINNSLRNNNVNIKLNSSIDWDENVIESLNCSILENNIEYGDFGIDITVALQSNISTNKIWNCKTGVRITQSPDSFISANNLTNCDIDFGSDYSALLSLNITLTNTVDGKNIYIYKNTTNIDFDDVNFLGTASRVILVQCNDSIITGLSLNSQTIYGILLYECQNITVASATITNVVKGIHVESSSNITLQSNILSNLGGSGITLGWITQDSKLIGNQISNVGSSELGTTFGRGYGIYGYGANMTINANTIRQCPQAGISVSTEGFFLNNLVEDCLWGISSTSSDNITILGNRINHCEYGMMAGFWSDSILIKNNVFSENKVALQITEIMFCANFTIADNQFIGNTQNGIVLDMVNNLTIFRNTFLNNQKGIQVSWSQGNLIYYNNFTGNQIHARDDGDYNLWDNGSIGNYWDNYNGVDANHDGIGDTPYSISGTANAQDRFPIYVEVATPNAMLFYIIISIFIVGAIIVTIFILKIILNRNSKTKEQGTSSSIFDDVSSRQNETASQIKEYLETDKSIEEMPEIQHLLTTLASTEIVQKLEKLNFTNDEKRLLAMDLISLTPKERVKLLDEILKHQN